MDDPREQRYRMILQRLEDLVKEDEELRQRIEDVAVRTEETHTAQAAILERLEDLDRLYETPCPHKQTIEDLKITTFELGHQIDKLSTDLDNICCAASLPLPSLEGDEQKCLSADPLELSEDVPPEAQA